MKKALFILLIISIALNGYLINKMFKFKHIIASYKTYSNNLKNQLDDIKQKANRLEYNVKNAISKSLKDK